MRTSLVLSTACAAALLSAQAHAQDPAAAQALFDEGKRLTAAHDFADACPKFEESQRLDPGLGTLFHVADCEEHLGKTATAWAAFLEVASEAKAQGESARESAARDRAAALEPRLARLTIDAGASSATPGFTLLRDDTPVGGAQWMIAVPVDPGTHVVVARAPSKGTWTTTVDLAPGTKREVTVPLLADSPVEASSASAVSSTTTTAAETGGASHGAAQRATSIVFGALGLAGLGVGGAFAIDSLLRHNDAQSHCGADGCDAAGVTFRNQARTAGDTATVSFAGGGAFLLAGILTYVTAPNRSPSGATRSSAGLVFSVGPGGGFVRGTW